MKPTKNGSQPRTIQDSGWGQLEIWDVATSEESLYRLLEDLFSNYWDKLCFGPLIQGAAWEIRADGPPESIGMLDGYLTVDFGKWHFHICIGEHKGTRAHPVEPDLARHRRTSRAELYRKINRDGTPDSWGLRLFNGNGEQQITVMFANPFLSDEMHYLKKPDWSRLEAWDHVRKAYLSLDPDPRDRSGRRMIHG